MSHLGSFYLGLVVGEVVAVLIVVLGYRLAERRAADPSSTSTHG